MADDSQNTDTINEGQTADEIAAAEAAAKEAADKAAAEAAAATEAAKPKASKGKAPEPAAAAPAPALPARIVLNADYSWLQEGAFIERKAGEAIHDPDEIAYFVGREANFYVAE